MNNNDPLLEDLKNRQNDPYALAKYEILLESLGNIKGLTAKVVGAGDGIFAILLAKAGAQITASEIQPEYLELAKKNASTQNVEIKFQVEDLSNLRDKEHYDLVIATDVIEHIKDDQAAANGLCSLCKPGGTLVVTVPAMQILFGIHDVNLGHFKRYSMNELTLLFPNTKTKRIRYFGFFLVPIAFILSRIAKSSYPKNQSDSQIKKFLFFVLKKLLNFEKKFPFPLGTSLLMISQMPETTLYEKEVKS